MNLSIPNYVHFSSEDEEDECNNTLYYISSEEEEENILPHMIKKDYMINTLNILFYLTHILEPTINHKQDINQYVVLLNILCKKVDSKIFWYWDNPKIFNYNDVWLISTIEKFVNYIESIKKINKLDNIHVKKEYDTKDIVNEFYLDFMNKTPINSKENIVECFKSSNSLKYKDKICTNYVFDYEL